MYNYKEKTMIDIIVGIILVIVCGTIESKHKKHNFSYGFLSVVGLFYALTCNDWTYLLYPFGIIITCSIITYRRLKRIENNEKVVN